MKVLATAKHELPFSLSGDPLQAHSYEQALQARRKASEFEIDYNGHVNNVVYIGWAQDIGIAHWDMVADSSTQEKFVWVGTQHVVDYQSELLLNDDIVISTWLEKPRGPVMARHVDIRQKDADQFAALVVSQWCLLEAVTKKPRRVDRNVGRLFGF